MPGSRLFKPLQIGHVQVQHRIAMAPMTRLRATDDHVPVPMMKEYYGQRAAIPGTLILSEGTFVSKSACGGFANSPGIWTEEQVAAWRTITDEVHSRGCFMFCQLFAMGRAADPEVAKQEGVEIVGPSAIPIDGSSPVPRAMTTEEVKQVVRDFAKAAQNAIAAGFDGVECHGANGYLVDQFIQDVSNKRTDEYGGSIENRSRLMMDILTAVADAIGPERVGFRLSPWSPFQGMRMENPIPQFADIVDRANRLGLAYLHLVESRVAGADDYDGSERLDFAYKLWDGPILVAGGYRRVADVQRLLDTDYPGKDIVAVIGRYFISNPDLVYRFREGLELTRYERGTFYTKSARGYTDYPFSPEYLEKCAVQV